MDDQRFDGLVRALGRGTSRRGALGFLAAAAGLGLREVSAKATHHHKGKGKGKGKPGKGNGKPTAQGKPAPKCRPDKKCVPWCASTANPSQCTREATTCEGACYACGPGCGRTCRKTLCGDTCLDTQNDPTHCGSCGHACPAQDGAHSPGCRAGVCVMICDAGHADCDNDPSNGCETSLGTVLDCLHCGDSCTHFADQCNAPICGANGCEAQPTNEGQGCNGGTGTCQNGQCQVTCVLRNGLCLGTSRTCCDADRVCGDDACGNTSVCLGTAGASCSGNCDCLGYLICDLSSQECVAP